MQKIISLIGIGAIVIAQPVSACEAHARQVAYRSQCNTIASYYGHGDIYHGQRTASGEILNGYGLSAAHRTLPFGTSLKVTNIENGKSVLVKVNDRGPYVASRSLDLSYGAFIKIEDPRRGLAKVCVSEVA